MELAGATQIPFVVWGWHHSCFLVMVPVVAQGPVTTSTMTASGATTRRQKGAALTTIADE